MTTIFLYNIQVKFIGILQNLYGYTGLNMEKALRSSTIFGNLSLKTKWKCIFPKARKKTLAWSLPNSYIHIKKKTNVMTRCRTPDFCERYKIDFGMYDLKSKRILPRSAKQRDVWVYIHKNHSCVIWKNRKDALLDGAEKIERNFKYVKNKINKDKLTQSIRYRFPKRDIKIN